MRLFVLVPLCCAGSLRAPPAGGGGDPRVCEAAAPGCSCSQNRAVPDAFSAAAAVPSQHGCGGGIHAEGCVRRPATVRVHMRCCARQARCARGATRGAIEEQCMHEGTVNACLFAGCCGVARGGAHTACVFKLTHARVTARQGRSGMQSMHSACTAHAHCGLLVWCGSGAGLALGQPVLAPCCFGRCGGRRAASAGLMWRLMYAGGIRASGNGRGGGQAAFRV